MKRTLLTVFGPLCLMPVAAQPQSITIPAGTQISIRTTSAINSRKADKSTEYPVSMDDPVTVDGVVVVPVNANAWLRVTDLNNPRLVGRASMSTALVAVTGMNGQRIDVITGNVDSQAGSHAKRTLAGAGVGAGAGAAIGSVGGGVGAGIGAATGAAVGGAIGKITGNNEGVTIPAETRYTYTLNQPVTIAYQGPGQAPAPQTVSRTDYRPSPVAPPPPVASDRPLPPDAPPPPPLDTPPPPPQDSSAPTVGVQPGQTKDQVIALLGQPDKIVKSGTAEIYRYKDVKVMFVNGKVTEVY